MVSYVLAKQKGINFLRKFRKKLNERFYRRRDKKMDLLEAFTLHAQESMNSYVKETHFDNNFVLEDEYTTWVEYTFSSDTPWCIFTDRDISISNMNLMLEMCYEYSYEMEMDMPYDVKGLLWMYGHAMEKEMRSTLFDDFSSLMLEKQDGLN